MGYYQRFVPRVFQDEGRLCRAADPQIRNLDFRSGDTDVGRGNFVRLLPGYYLLIQLPKPRLMRRVADQ